MDTYGEFVDANKERLRTIPPPPIAVEYYLNDEHYLFDKMHTGLPDGVKRRPPCATLYDVFSNIRDDEEQHVLTMTACEEWSKGGRPPVDLGFNFNSKLTKEEYVRKVTQSSHGRAAWIAWGDEVARIAEQDRAEWDARQ